MRFLENCICFEQHDTYFDCALSSTCCVFLAVDGTVEFPSCDILRGWDNDRRNIKLDRGEFSDAKPQSEDFK